jgi:predicted  nucleic acid-binding Zn-ribbon protein
MGATLEALHRLQEFELQIAEIRRGIDRKHRAVQKQEERITQLDAQIRAEQSAMRTDQMESDRFDLDLKSRDAEIAKYRQALQVAKTNKEYSAILTQLNTHKADNSKLEEKVLGLMGQVDIRRKTLAGLNEQRAAEAGRLSELQAAAQAEEDRCRDRLSALQADRDQAAAAVPPKALDFFNRVSQKNDGVAMAKVIRTHPKRAEYACDGCNMSINIEQVNAIMSRDEAITCNTCGRILYVDMPTATKAS